jgi:biotin transport system permease protein
VAGKLGASLPPFAFRRGASPLHRCPAAVKLLALIGLSCAAYHSVFGLAAAALLLSVCAVRAGIPPWQLLKGSRPLAVLSLCVIALRTFEPGAPGIRTPECIIWNRYIPDMHLPGVSAAGFGAGLLTAAQMLVVFAAAALLFAVTSMRELRRSLGAVEKRLTLLVFKRPGGRFSLSISLMLGFIPRFFELWDDMNAACESRSGKRGSRRLFVLIPLVTERMLQTAAETALALEARGCESP